MHVSCVIIFFCFKMTFSQYQVNYNDQSIPFVFSSQPNDKPCHLYAPPIQSPTILSAGATMMVMAKHNVCMQRAVLCWRDLSMVSLWKSVSLIMGKSVVRTDNPVSSIMLFSWYQGRIYIIMVSKFKCITSVSEARSPNSLSPILKYAVWSMNINWKSSVTKEVWSRQNVYTIKLLV